MRYCPGTEILNNRKFYRNVEKNQFSTLLDIYITLDYNLSRESVGMTFFRNVYAKVKIIYIEKSPCLGIPYTLA